MIQHSYFWIKYLLSAAVGAFGAWVDPVMPFILLCSFAVAVDCLTAWRLDRRIRRKFPNAGAEGKLKSAHMSKIIWDLLVVFLCVKLAHDIDLHILEFADGLHLGNYVAAVFCLVQFVSILENESSCNGATWAKVLQRVLADKTSRHISVTIDEINKMRQEETKE